jgi:hypothetical protein
MSVSSIELESVATAPLYEFRYGYDNPEEPDG